jgi:acetyl esterase/lipase
MMSTRPARLLACAAVALCSLAPAHAQTELRLWPGEAPGSERWSIPESTTTSASGDRVITNVSDPSLTVFLPDAAIATGAAAVIAPGGALRALAFDNEGVKLAAWLNERGIAGFVAALAEVLALAVADAQAALKLVRSRAGEWGIDRERVGIIGFSAGGGVAVGTALAERSDASPDFLVSVYGPSLQDVNVPARAPPLFIAVGATHFNVTNGCLALFAAWKAAGKPAEIHVYDGISAGFGMSKRGHPVDGWTDRLYEWLVARELTRPIDPDR